MLRRTEPERFTMQDWVLRNITELRWLGLIVGGAVVIGVLTNL